MTIRLVMKSNATCVPDGDYSISTVVHSPVGEIVTTLAYKKRRNNDGSLQGIDIEFIVHTSSIILLFFLRAQQGLHRRSTYAETTTVPLKVLDEH